MPSFVSQFGAVSLAVQEELRRSVERKEGVARVGNFVVVTLDRETFLREGGSIEPNVIEQFRNDLTREIYAFMEANEWSMSGPPSLNLLFRSIGIPGTAKVEHRRALYTLKILDDRGVQTIPVLWPAVIVGREHEAPPRSFVPVRDASLSFSREHLILSYRDLTLYATLRGKNPTTINNEPLLYETEMSLQAGDAIRCGPHTIILEVEDAEDRK